MRLDESSWHPRWKTFQEQDLSKVLHGKPLAGMSSILMKIYYFRRLMDFMVSHGASSVMVYHLGDLICHVISKLPLLNTEFLQAVFMSLPRSMQVQVGAVGGSEAVTTLLQTAGEVAAAAGATKAEIMQKALGHRVLPANHPEATKPEEAYMYVAELAFHLRK